MYERKYIHVTVTVNVHVHVHLQCRRNAKWIKLHRRKCDTSIHTCIHYVPVLYCVQHMYSTFNYKDEHTCTCTVHINIVTIYFHHLYTFTLTDM